MIDDGDRPSASSEQRRRDALAYQLHAVIRHGSPPRASWFSRGARSGAPDVGRMIDRAICVVDELARASRITARVWSEALHSALASGRKEPP